MRLIDADTLCSSLIELKNTAINKFDDCVGEIAENRLGQSIVTFNECIALVNEQPTIEPKQKEGTWMGGNLGYFTCCGVDGCASDIWDCCEDDNKCFCPNCGARITKFILYWDEGYMKKEEWLKTKGVSTEK